MIKTYKRHFLSLVNASEDRKVTRPMISMSSSNLL